MSARKRCNKKTGCSRSPRCEHPWWLDVTYRKRRYRMNVNEFALARGADHTVVTRQEAEKVWEPLFIAELVAGKDPRRQPAQGTNGELTVAEFLDIYRVRHCEAQRLSMEKLGSKLDVLKQRLGHLPLRELERPGPIEDFKSDLVQARRTNATINRYLAQLRHMINWAIGRELLHQSPFFHKTRNPNGIALLRGENERSRRIYPPEEKKLVTAAQQMRTPVYRYSGAGMQARLEIALDKGLRRGEMLKLQNLDIDWRARPQPVVTIKWGNAKNRRTRKIPLVSPRVVAWLQSRRAVGGPEGYPYGDPRGRYVKSFQTSWITLLALAGITDPEENLDGDLHWHDFRHECGSRYAEQGMDVRRIQYLMGHANLKTTERYLNVNQNLLGEAMRKVMNW